MVEAKPMQPFADRTAMHRHAMDRGHFHGDLVQRQVAIDHQPIAQPSAKAGELALGMIALCLRHKATALALQDHHVVHEARRNPKVPRGLSKAMTFRKEGGDTAAKFHRMWLAHSNPLYLAGPENHKPLNLGIPNR